MAAPAPTREDTFLITATVDDRPIGIFDKWSGGEVDSEESKYRPGGMLDEISLGGRRTIGNVTIDRYYDVLRDHPLYKWLMSVAGAVRGTVSWTPLDFRGRVVGEAVVLGGTFKRVERGDLDSEGNDAAELELEFTIDSFS